MKNNKIESKKKAGKAVRLNEISNMGTKEIYYILRKGKKLQLMFMDRGCKI
jgi:hypothetical protein